MAKKKRHTAAEITAKLAEADTLAVKGRKQSDIAKALGISVMTFHRWRKDRASTPRSRTAPVTAAAASSDVTEQERLARTSELQLENSRLRRLVTDLLLEKMRREDEQQRRMGRSARA